MKSLTFDYENTCNVSSADINDLCIQLLPEIERIAQAHANSNYATDYASVNLPFDAALLEKITSVVKEKKHLNPTLLVIIGIGGSNLGTMAVLEALYGTFYNQYLEMQVYFVDTVDSDHIADIAQLVEHELSTGNNILINVISKSGNTTETIANFEVFLEILKNHRPYNYHQFIITTTDCGSPLYELSQQEEFTVLDIPEHVGGRYSVFSAVGLFPLCFLGIDSEQLLQGARSGVEIGTQQKFQDNFAAISAILIAAHYRKNRIIHDTFLFSVALEKLGAWYRQLSAESLGKAFNRRNEQVAIGILPTISIGSTDLHSVAQLYLGGPDNRFTTFIDVTNNATNITVPNYQDFEALVPSLQNKQLSTIMNAILQGTKQAYRNDNRPFVSWTLPEKSAFYIGQFMQIKMIEIIYVGYLFNINPFDQPEVEKYKKETKKLLAKT